MSLFESRSRSRRKSLLAERAMRMRHAATPSESALWSARRGGALGVTFRRQSTISGSWHSVRSPADARRDRKHGQLGFTVLRLPNGLVERQLPVAVQQVRDAIAALRGAL